jgi:hypothetical protein
LQRSGSEQQAAKALAIAVDCAFLASGRQVLVSE